MNSSSTSTLPHSSKLSKLGKKSSKNKKKESERKIGTSFEDVSHNEHSGAREQAENDYSNDFNEKLNKKLSLTSKNPYCYDNDDVSMNSPNNNCSPSPNPPLVSEYGNKKKVVHHGEYRYASTDELKQKLLLLKQNNKLNNDVDSEESENNSTTIRTSNNSNGSQQTLGSISSFRSINSRTPSPNEINKNPISFTTETVETTLKPPIPVKSLNNVKIPKKEEIFNGNPSITVNEISNENHLKVPPLIKFRSVSNSTTSTSCNSSTTIAVTDSTKKLLKNEETSTDHLKNSVKYATSGTNTEEVERVSVATNTEVEFQSVEINTDDISDNIIAVSCCDDNNSKRKKFNSYLISVRFMIVLLRSKKFAFSLEKTVKTFIRKTNDENINWNGLYLDKIKFGCNEFIIIQKLYNVPYMVTYPGFSVSS